MSPSSPPRQFGAPEVSFPGALACAWMAGAYQGSFTRGAQKLRTNIKSDNCGERRCLRGMYPLRSARSRNVQPIRPIWCIHFHSNKQIKGTPHLNGAPLVMLIYLSFLSSPLSFFFSLFFPSFFLFSLLSLSLFFFWGHFNDPDGAGAPKDSRVRPCLRITFKFNHGLLLLLSL